MIFLILGDIEFDALTLGEPTSLVFARFVAIMIMHIYVLDEIMNGATMMKYAMNHWWKFKYPGYAYLSGFLQITAMYIIEIANTLVVMTSPNILEVVKDLMALTIISEIDDFFAYGTGDSFARQLCNDHDTYENMFEIEVTTSKSAITDPDSQKYGDRPIVPSPVHDLCVKNERELRKYVDDDF